MLKLNAILPYLFKSEFLSIRSKPFNIRNKVLCVSENERKSSEIFSQTC